MPKGSKKCDGKCHKTKCVDCPEITAEKNLLNLSYLTEGAVSSTPDVCVTYEIIIFNRSHHDLTHLTVDDTFCGFMPNTLTSGGGGELRAYFTNVMATSIHPTIIPNTFDQIVATKGQLLGAGSYIPARSVCSIILRIAGRGFLLPVTPNGGQQITGDHVPDLNMALQNTAIICGHLKKKHECGCKTHVPIFPIYVKSGQNQTQKILNLTGL
jgi:hypothetical protein